MKDLYIVDGQKAIGQMLAESLVSRGYQVVGRSEKISTSVEEISELKPHVVVLEMVLSDGQGSVLIEKVRTFAPETRFLIFSDSKEGIDIKSCLQAGAHGFVEKSVDFDMFLNAVKIVAEGGCFFGFNITEVIRSVVGNRGGSDSRKDNLTDRERQVLCLIAEGNSNKDIAGKLGLSVKTIDNHRCSMMRKLDLHNVADITRYAVEHRLVEVNFVV
ncbi:LuxR C-terminal-related transcriptional regulator [Pelagicoccus albus]|uniref:Response regulator transcription factor n=1 Tax=Pelagicoccus albus TaxID=415222 RepID=A0A7X1B477_9BACT|nr:response regulator transcription factor [Pelagicoccus albus]MBC2605341.1 response regulator transcription factor [Pelagicoccus albus]